MRVSVDKNVLRLDVAMADALRVDVSNRAEELVCIYLDDEVWHHLFHLQVLLHSTVRCVWNVVHHNVQVYLFWLIPVRVE